MSAKTNILGGSYSEITSTYSDLGKGHGFEAHHIISSNVIDSINACEGFFGILVNEGPAIKMNRTDHRQTASYGGSYLADLYRDSQYGMIIEGKLSELWNDEMNDIQAKFGDKYDEHIIQAEKQLLKLDEQEKLQLESDFKTELVERQMSNTINVESNNNLDNDIGSNSQKQIDKLIEKDTELLKQEEEENKGKEQVQKSEQEVSQEQTQEEGQELEQEINQAQEQSQEQSVQQITR